MRSISKETVTRALEQNKYSLYPKPDSATAEWWTLFDRIRDEQGKFVAFVRCHRCCSLLIYNSKKTETSSISTHAKSCCAPLPNASQSIVTMFSRSTTSNVSADTKRLVTEPLALMCAEDMRPFEIVTGSGFEHFCQTLLDIEWKNKDQIDALSLLPDPTTVSRRLQSIAEGERLEVEHFDFKSSVFILNFFIWKCEHSFAKELVPRSIVPETGYDRFLKETLFFPVHSSRIQGGLRRNPPEYEQKWKQYSHRELIVPETATFQIVPATGKNQERCHILSETLSIIAMSLRNQAGYSRFQWFYLYA